MLRIVWISAEPKIHRYILAYIFCLIVCLVFHQRSTGGFLPNFCPKSKEKGKTLKPPSTTSPPPNQRIPCPFPSAPSPFHSSPLPGLPPALCLSLSSHACSPLSAHSTTAAYALRAASEETAATATNASFPPISPALPVPSLSSLRNPLEKKRKPMKKN